jgi:outer membrane protein assembly factor BamB
MTAPETSPPARTRLAFEPWCLAASLLLALSSFAAEPFDRLKFHAPPKPLAAGAQTEDWRRFLGPHDNATSGETKLLHDFPKAGPARVWEVEKGTGFGGPAIVGDHLVLFHRINNKETVDCVHAETGQRFWTFAYDAPYQDRYGSGDGPRSSPVIAGDSVYVYGISGHLRCLDLATGKERWQHELKKEFHLSSAFFGCGGTPLVSNGRVILNIGTADGTCAIAFAADIGKLLWRAKHEWGASYASPIAATLHGRDCILIFAGGESRPATGGLLCLDAKTGEVLSASPHRAEIAESVNASSPAFSGNRVFVTESYGSGGEAIDILPDFKAKPAWKADNFGVYFMTPVVKDGCLYACAGQQPRLTEFVCYDLATGKENWRDDLGGKFGRASLLAVDGAFLCLGEFGDLAWLELTPQRATVQQQTKLFNAPDTWTLPAVSRGLLYVCQNQRGGKAEPARLICYDLRGTP